MNNFSENDAKLFGFMLKERLELPITMSKLKSDFQKVESYKDC